MLGSDSSDFDEFEYTADLVKVRVYKWLGPETELLQTLPILEYHCCCNRTIHSFLALVQPLHK